MGHAGLTKNLLAGMIGVAIIAVAGCLGEGGGFGSHPAGRPLGTLSDPVWQNQEANAEHSDFVVHEHEFVREAEFLNRAGEDHLKQIAARLASGHYAMVLVERTRFSARPDTEYKYPVHTNSDLDMRRRDMVVRCLLAMHIANADALVVIAPDLAPEYRADDRAAIYQDTDTNSWGGNWGGGWNGGMGW